MSVEYQHNLHGQFDEGVANQKLRDGQRNDLIEAMKRVGLRPKHTAWVLALFVHDVATGDGVMRRSAPRLAVDPWVNKSVRSVRDARKKLAAFGVIEIIHERNLDGGSDLKAMRINRVAVRRLAAGDSVGVCSGVAQNLQPANQPANRGANQGASQGANSASLYRPNTQYPPPPSTASALPPLDQGQKAAVAILKIHLADAVLVRRLATEFTVEIADVVAEYEINSGLFRGPGAIRYRLDSGLWPTDEPMVSVGRQREIDQAKLVRREREAAELAEEGRRAAERDRREREVGPVLDAMSKDEFLAFGLRVLDASCLDGFRKWPGVYRPELLEALIFERVEA